MIATIEHSKDPYNAVIDIIDKWCSKHYYADVIVTLLLNNQITTEILLYDGSSHTFEWCNDWYEGQKDVEVVGFRTIDDLIFDGYPEEDDN